MEASVFYNVFLILGSFLFSGVCAASSSNTQGSLYDLDTLMTKTPGILTSDVEADLGHHVIQFIRHYLKQKDKSAYVKVNDNPTTQLVLDKLWEVKRLIKHGPLISKPPLDDSGEAPSLRRNFKISGQRIKGKNTMRKRTPLRDHNCGEPPCVWECRHRHTMRET